MPATLTAEELQALIAERDSLRGERDHLQGEVRVLTVERDLLQERLKAFLHRLFAAKSEARGTAQRDLFLNEAEALAATAAPAQEEAVGTPVAAHTRKKRERKPLDPALPREIVRHELPEAERVCPHDGAALVEIGVEVSEQLDIIPQQVRVIQHQRVKYACPCCDDGLKETPAPPRLIPKGLLTEAALAWVVTSKYQDALPLYRQAALLGRFGGDLSRNTLAASVVRAGLAVQPIINLLRDHLLDADLVYGDETVIQVLKEPGRAAQTKSYLWAQMNGTGPPARLFGYAQGRGAAQASELYAGIRPVAVLMTDGYEVYNAVAARHELVHLGCWAQARRYFVEAEAAIPKPARSPAQLATRFIAAMGTLCHRVPGQGHDAHRARPSLAAARPAGAAADRSAAAGTSACRGASQSPRQGFALPVPAVGQARPLYRQWGLAHRQQCLRERHPSLRRRPPQLALRRYRRGYPGQRQPLFPDRDLQGQPRRSLRLPGHAVPGTAKGKDRR
jgi:transposase